jgi:hypothetical protein
MPEGSATEGVWFPTAELLREALEEVAEADLGDYVEEPWGSSALAAATQVAEEGGPPELAALALRAVERVAERSELRELAEEDELFEAGVGRLWSELSGLR